MKHNLVIIPVRRLTIFLKNRLRGIRSILTKHVDLTKYSKNGLLNFNHSVGFQLFYEAGWECWIGIIPKFGQRAYALESKGINELCKSYFIGVRHRFQDGLLQNITSIRKSLLKNDINDIGTFSLLPDDQEKILEIFQIALDQTLLDDNFEVIIFSFRFGEKSRRGIDLKPFDLKEVARVTVHAAIDISLEDMDLMWSMSGLQQVVGQRGTLCNALSFRDCGNYQSNVDGRSMDITAELSVTVSSSHYAEWHFQ